MYGSKTHRGGRPTDSWDAFEEWKNDGKPAYSNNAVVEFKGSKKDDGGHHYTGGGERCFHKHPPLKLPGTELLIYGGSCSSPVVKDADAYVGFDESMHFTERHWPWKVGAEVLFQIPDMGVPKKPEEFKKLVKWVRGQLEEGKKVHCGCIGGHGRTGTFLAALVSDFGEKDAVTYVRKNYCAKAVESNTQVAFLAEHFGVTKVDGYKSAAMYTTGKTSKGSKSSGAPQAKGERFTHVGGNGCIWDAPPA
jgi:hypothetical protein